MIANLSAYRLARLKIRQPTFRLVYDDHMTGANSLSPLRALYPAVRWLACPAIRRAADSFVAVRPETKEFMGRQYGIPPERIRVIPLGADDALFRHDPTARAEVRRELSLSDADTLFIYTGKLIPFKRLPLLIEAVGLVAGRGPSTKVLLLGEGDSAYNAELQRLVAERHLTRFFTWHKAVPNRDLYRYYSAADVAVWPYGASISMRETMACGLPIILGEAGGQPGIPQQRGEQVPSRTLRRCPQPQGHRREAQDDDSRRGYALPLPAERA